MDDPVKYLTVQIPLCPTHNRRLVIRRTQRGIEFVTQSYYCDICGYCHRAVLPLQLWELLNPSKNSAND